MVITSASEIPFTVNSKYDEHFIMKIVSFVRKIESITRTETHQIKYLLKVTKGGSFEKFM